MLFRTASLMTVSMFLATGCGPLGDLVEEALSEDGAGEGGGGKGEDVPPPPDDPDGCGCEATAKEIAGHCFAYADGEEELNACGQRHRDALAHCLATCGEGKEDPGPPPPPAREPRVEVGCDTAAGYRPEVNVFGPSGPGRMDVLRVYESRNDHGFNYHPMGDLKVSVLSPDTETLVLSSYEPSFWHVHPVGKGQLRRIIVTGYHEQKVDAPEGVEVQSFVGADQWLELGDRDRGGEQLLIERVVEMTMVKPTTSAYCYSGTGFGVF